MLLTQERNRTLWLLKIPPTIRAWLFGILLLAAVLLLASIGDCEASQGAFTHDARPQAVMKTSPDIRPKVQGDARTPENSAGAEQRICGAGSFCMLRPTSLLIPQDGEEVTAAQ